MKILHLNYFDNIGGAGRAAYRIHHALRQAGAESILLVKDTTISDWTVQRLAQKTSITYRIQRRLVDTLLSQFSTTNPTLHSPDVFSAIDVKHINQRNVDVVHLHWFNSGMLSIADVGKINRPIVWTLHDMWAFCGAEHITYESRWKEGYRKDNRPAYEGGFDLNRWTWERKRKYWQHPMQIVTPSHWLAGCVRQSALMREWPVMVIPNAIDTSLWRPAGKSLARQVLNLPPDVPLMAFGAAGGGDDPNKGFDLLKDSLAHLRGEIAGLELVVFGQSAPKSPFDRGFPVHYMGHLYDEVSLRLLYSAVDLVVIPSRVENLPNIGIEAQACCTPVVAFNTGGLPDIVEHRQTGYLAEPFDTLDLAEGIKWTLGKREEGTLQSQARKRVVERFDSRVVAEQYLAVYKRLAT